MTHPISKFLAAALLLSPIAASARPAPHPAPAATHAPAPAEAPAPPAMAPDDDSFPGDAVSDADMWVDDDLLAFGVGDDFFLESGDLEGGDVDGPGDMDETPGPGGAPRAPGSGGGPGPGGMRHGPGMGMGQGMMMRRGWLGGRPMMRHGMPMMMRLQLAQVDLSDAQRDKLRDLHEAAARRAIQRRADMALAQMDLHKLMRAEKPDVGAVNGQIDKLTRLHADGLKAAFDMRMQARAVLTPDQLKKLQGRMAPMMHHGMMDGPDGAPKR